MKLPAVALFAVTVIVCWTVQSFAANRCYENVEQKRYDEAIQECTKQLDDELSDKERAAVLHNRGRAYRNKGMNDRAIEDFNRSIRLDPNSKYAWNSRGMAYRNKGMFNRAISDYNRAVQIDPNHEYAWSNRGNAYKAKGMYARAVEDYKKAIQLYPDNADPYYNMACLHSIRNNSAEACKWLQRAVGKGFSDWAHIRKDKDLEKIRNRSCYSEIMAGK
jgi:tetratricopeptide (TPR) repeat protein